MVPKERPVCWILIGLAIVGVYAAYFGVMIGRHTAIPFFDQTNYVGKVLDISDGWRQAGSAWAYFDPMVYLRAGFQARPPLMMVLPALLWGNLATPHQIAWCWLASRLLALTLGVGLLARCIGTTRFVPATLATVLGSAFMLQVHPNLYLMDTSFISFAVLAFALVLWAMERPTAWSALGACAGALALLLIKPQGLTLLFPMFVILAVRWLVWLVQMLKLKSTTLSAWRAPMAIYAGAAVIVVLLAISPYGQTVREQYRLGQQGYWAGPVPLDLRIKSLAVVAPLWTVALLGISWVWQKRLGASWWTVAMTAATLLWWMVFTMWLTYTFDPRIIAGASGIAVAMILAMACQNRALASAATTLGLAVFGLNLAVATGAIPRPGFAQATLLVLGPIAKPQPAIHEVGLTPLVERIASELRDADGPQHDRRIETLIMDDFVDYSSLDLLRRLRHEVGFRFSPVPWGTEDFQLQSLLANGWFLTKRPQTSIVLGGDALGTLHALDRLVTAEDSPLRPLLERRLSGNIHRYTAMSYSDDLLAPDERPPFPFRDEEVTLWRLRRPPTTQELHAALLYVEPDFRGTKGHTLVLRQIEDIDRRN